MYQAAPSSYPGMGGRGARGRVCHQRPHAPVGTASAATVMSTDTISVGTRRPMNLAAPAPLLGMGRRGAGGTMCHQRPHAHLQRLLSLSPSLTAGAHFHPWTRAPPATAGSGPSLYSASCLPPRPRRVSSTPHPLPEPIKPTSCTTHGAGSPDNRPTQRRPHSDTHPATPRRPPAWEPTLTPHSGPQRSHTRGKGPIRALPQASPPSPPASVHACPRRGCRVDLVVAAQRSSSRSRASLGSAI